MATLSHIDTYILLIVMAELAMSSVTRRILSALDAHQVGDLVVDTASPYLVLLLYPACHCSS